KLTGNLNLLALEKSLIRLIDRHQIFKVIFENNFDGPIQKIRQFKFKLILEDISTNSTSLNSIINNEANQKFDLEIGPLFRIRLLKIYKTEHILLITLHHIISYLYSLRIIIN
ncbi:MAG: hypothetical protein KDC52_13910, partial [Ignavibacteriae bacterium]|nr:hypothetical protein [Ignavibacteriota bacterium]